MSIRVLVIGESGSGKSRSMKFFDDKELGIIQIVNKPLPFKTTNRGYVTNDYNKIKGALAKNARPSYVIDDAGYLLTGEFMGTINTVGYDKYNKMAFNYYDLLEFENVLGDNTIVYNFMHPEYDQFSGEITGPKTIGKLLNEKINIPGLFTIVILCVNENGEHKFYVNNKGCAKSPEDMFEQDSYDNNLKFIDDKIREYYNIPRQQKKENKEEKGE